MADVFGRLVPGRRRRRQLVGVSRTCGGRDEEGGGQPQPPSPDRLETRNVVSVHALSMRPPEGGVQTKLGKTAAKRQ
jgi:hypothetical protein